MRGIVQFSAGLLLALAIDASAEVYRWVDEHGVVNYGSRPPAGSKAKQVDADAAPLSVVPAPPKPASVAPGVAEQAALRARVRSLEAQAEEERRQRALLQAAESERLAQARADCEAQRRLNCDSDPFGLYEPTVIASPLLRPIVVRPHRPLGHRPALPGFHRQSPAPMSSHVPHRR